jgi:tRNA threonylcarbamoyladenosine biosynthesis protein TsaE
MTTTFPCIPLPDEDATLDLGRRLALGVVPGAVLHLHGDLGAGKTTLVRGLLRALGHAGRVKSPTYALVEAYALSSLSLYHFDFYRFDTPTELRDSGLLEHFGGTDICLVEWPEKAGSQLPVPDLAITLETTPDGGRSAAVTAHTDRGAQWARDALK